MSERLNLNERYQNILKATINHYIATAEPVGSKILAQEYNLSVSSATIRNAMGKLEKAGLLYQPHASAGRIPSDSGYRIYVDYLTTPDLILGRQIEDLLEQQVRIDSWSFENLLQRATKILAALSGYIALITFPQNPANVILHLQIVSISKRQLMLIVVTDSYHTESVLIDLPIIANSPEFNQQELEEELQIISNFLNSQIKGKYLTELSKLDWVQIDKEFKKYADFLHYLCQELSCLAKPNQAPEILIRGISKVLVQPEFSHLDQIKRLLNLLEVEQNQLIPLIMSNSDLQPKNTKVNVRIGSENPLESMKICTLISANYYQDEIPVGSVGIIGPTRMLYDQAIALVESTADYLSEALS